MVPRQSIRAELAPFLFITSQHGIRYIVLHPIRTFASDPRGDDGCVRLVLPYLLVAPEVMSRPVWRSISAFSCAPTSTTIIEIHIHTIMPTAAPSEP